MWWLKKKKPAKCKCPCHWKGYPVCDACMPFHKPKRRLKSVSERRKIIKEIDQLFRQVIRVRDDWTCIKCRRKYKPNISPRTGELVNSLMTTSHFFSVGRGQFSVRWNEDDCDAMCLFCHMKVENHKHETIEGFNYEEFKKEQLGDDKYVWLEYKVSIPTIFNMSELEIIKLEMENRLQELLK